ncbi:MAPEG family protein [Sphingomonas sp. So64.6b]|uniref:MAPEG family protein n=1 Tax=Sphingomonas sp. So64.6b TaxID=2997354 RepID=UPI0016003A0B|nr:MAPEG family protein [Sphingomonas sp. So64.6b]QNA84387.1 MAPEG family protein [Sphingomonas sp. So64.6b]
MTTIAILWPTFAMVALVTIIWFTMFVQRFSHIKRNPPTARDFADGEAALRYFRPVEMPANNLTNLFEMPVMYFALVPLLMITHQANHVQVILAWIYVVLRAVHSFIHIGPKKVQPRFMVYVASCAVLMAMWIGFFVDMLGAANTLSRLS